MNRGVSIASLDGGDMERKTILVTGAAGFIGGHVAGLYARQGWHVIGLGHGALSQLEQTRIGLTEWHSHDVSLSVLKEYAGEALDCNSLCRWQSCWCFY